MKKTKFIGKKIQIFAKLLRRMKKALCDMSRGMYAKRSFIQLAMESSSSDKDDLIHFLIHLCGDEMDEERGTESWTDAIDRSGM